METTHSKNRRTKSPDAKIVVPSWDSVWQSFRENNEIISIDAMNAEGWKTVTQVAEETSLSRSHINFMANNGSLERTKRKVSCGGKIREINFVRPKLNDILK